MKHFSAQWASWCHLKIVADTLIFKQNRRDVDYLFSFTLILLLNHLSIFFQTLKQQNPPFYQRLLLEVAGYDCQPDSYNPPELFSVPLSLSLLPSLGEITRKIFFALGKTHHIAFGYDLYIYGEINLQYSNFLCLVILSEMSKYIIMELPHTWKTFQFLLQFKRERDSESLLEVLPGSAGLWATQQLSENLIEMLTCAKNHIAACFRYVMESSTSVGLLSCL